jgi:hypothetical protein
MSESKLDRIEGKVDKVYDKLSELNTITVKQQVILDEHVKRSTMLEDKMVPVEKHVARVDGALKLVGLIGVIAAIAESIAIVSEWLHK